MAQASNAEGLLAFYPIRLKLMPSVNKMPSIGEELESFVVTVNQKDQIEGITETLKFTSPKFTDEEQDSIKITVTGQEDN